MRNYSVFTENPAAGGGEAITKYVCNKSSTSDATVAAQLIALHQYFIVAAGTKVTKIEVGAGVSGPTLPLDFPVAAYEVLDFLDDAIIPMDEYGVSFGLGTLAVAGVGAVISRRTTTAGRSGRGRLTTPWLGSRAVTDIGQLDAAAKAAMLLGCQRYLDGDPAGISGLTVIDVEEQVAGALGPLPIAARSISSDLGRVRSRRH